MADFLYAFCMCVVVLTLVQKWWEIVLIMKHDPNHIWTCKLIVTLLLQHIHNIVVEAIIRRGPLPSVPALCWNPHPRHTGAQTCWCRQIRYLSERSTLGVGTWFYLNRIGVCASVKKSKSVGRLRNHNIIVALILREVNWMFFRCQLKIPYRFTKSTKKWSLNTLCKEIASIIVGK